MAAGHVLLGFICAAFIGGSGLPGGGGVVYERESRERFWLQPRGGASAVIEAARKEIGVREVGENAGKRVDEYNGYVGFRMVPWCASFVSFCFGQAGYSEPKTAWSPALFPRGRLGSVPLPGMVMGIYFPSMGRIAHCGFVEEVRGEWVQTIEGNTGPEGSREGIGVFRRLRHKRTICKYADWIKKEDYGKI